MSALFHDCDYWLENLAVSTVVFGRLRYAMRYAIRHGILSLLVVTFSAAAVYGLLYPQPYQVMLGVSRIFLLLLVVDAVCGPLLTLLLTSPRKSRRERWVDFTLIGLMQLAALLYGLHSVWIGRPVVLAFEVDRLVVATANEVQTETDSLAQAPEGMQRLPWWGVLQVGTRSPQGNEEMFASVALSMSGVSPAMRPGWWQPWDMAVEGIRRRAIPVTRLLRHRSQDAVTLQAAIATTGLPAEYLSYLPLTSRQTKDWIVLLDREIRIVGYAQIDGFVALD